MDTFFSSSLILENHCEQVTEIVTNYRVFAKMMTHGYVDADTDFSIFFPLSVEDVLQHSEAMPLNHKTNFRMEMHGL